MTRHLIAAHWPRIMAGGLGLYALCVAVTLAVVMFSS